MPSRMLFTGCVAPSDRQLTAESPLSSRNAFCSVEQVFAVIDTAGGHFPRILVHRVTVLPHEMDLPVVRDSDNADCRAALHDGVPAGIAVRIERVILAHA